MVHDPIRDEDELPEVYWYYLSFADPTLLKGTQFLGAVIIQWYDISSPEMMRNLMDYLWTFNLNPGGEIMWIQIPKGTVPLKKYTHRILSREDIAAMDKEMLESGL
jgi:hypothetical protein